MHTSLFDYWISCFLWYSILAEREAALTVWLVKPNWMIRAHSGFSMVFRPVLYGLLEDQASNVCPVICARWFSCYWLSDAVDENFRTDRWDDTLLILHVWAIVLVNQLSLLRLLYLLESWGRSRKFWRIHVNSCECEMIERYPTEVEDQHLFSVDD